MTGQMFEFVENHKNGIILRVRLSPNSSCCAVNGIMETLPGTAVLKISLNAIPEKGKANKELIAFVAKKLKISKSCIELVSGETDRMKRLLLIGDKQELMEKITNWLGNDIDAK